MSPLAAWGPPWIACSSGQVRPFFAGFARSSPGGSALSTEAVAWVVVGGRGTLIGPVIGAVLVQRAQQEISSFSPVVWPMIIGLMFVAVAFLQSEAVERFAKRLAGRKSEVAP